MEHTPLGKVNYPLLFDALREQFWLEEDVFMEYRPVDFNVVSAMGLRGYELLGVFWACILFITFYLIISISRILARLDLFFDRKVLVF